MLLSVVSKMNDCRVSIISAILVSAISPARRSFDGPSTGSGRAFAISQSPSKVPGRLARLIAMSTQLTQWSDTLVADATFVARATQDKKRPDDGGCHRASCLT
jgi:hypothetical protein